MLRFSNSIQVFVLSKYKDRHSSSKEVQKFFSCLAEGYMLHLRKLLLFILEYQSLLSIYLFVHLYIYLLYHFVPDSSLKSVV